MSLRRVLLLSICTPAVVAGQSTVTVSREPTLRLPATTESGDARFSTAGWATRLASGAIAVADVGDAVIHVFAADGSKLRTLGRRGRGPGEFQFAGWVGRCGSDSLVVWDFAAGRVTTLSASEPLPPTPPTRQIAGGQGSFVAACGASGQLALFVDTRPRNEVQPIAAGRTSQGGEYRISPVGAVVEISDKSGRVLSRIDGVMQSEMVMGSLTPEGGRGGFPRPLGNATSLAFAGDRLVVAYADSSRVIGYSTDGKEAFRFSVPPSAAKVTPEDYRRAMAPAFAMMPGQMRDRLVAFAEAVPAPTTAPSFWRVLTDPTGLIWLAVSPEGAKATMLRAYDDKGRQRAEIVLPDGAVPFEIGRDYVLGRSEDEDGEQAIVLYRLTRR